MILSQIASKYGSTPRSANAGIDVVVVSVEDIVLIVVGPVKVTTDVKVLKAVLVTACGLASEVTVW